MKKSYLHHCLRMAFIQLLILNFCFLSTAAIAATTYSYDDRQRLKEVSYMQGNSVMYIYDTTGNRIFENVVATPGPVSYYQKSFEGLTFIFDTQTRASQSYAFNNKPTNY